MCFSKPFEAETIHLERTLALTPTLSPEEREKLLDTPERSLIRHFFQRWNNFSLSHRMGEGRGEGSMLPARGIIPLLFFVVNVGWAAPMELSRQTIILPVNAGPPLFADVDEDGRSDLSVIDLVEKKFLNYHQRPTGFGNAADQSIPLPPQTAWVALCDVDSRPGLELLFSTATGLIYSRQNDGLFESEQHTLIEAKQPFTDFNFPNLTLIATNKSGTNDLIPVISAGQLVLYHRDGVYKWSPGSSQPLDAKRASWNIDRGAYDWISESGGSNARRKQRFIELDDHAWTIGGNPAYNLRVQQSVRAKPDPNPNGEPENAAVRKVIDEMKKGTSEGAVRTNRVDFDGDGREDLVLWQCSGKLDCKTDFYFFRRGANQQLPAQPTQILRARGFPFPVRSANEASPLGDINADGVAELVMLELNTSFTTPSGFLETALSHGLDWSLTIRTFNHGNFSRSPNVSFPVTAVLPLDNSNEWPFFIHGDFNGDGRPDFVVRRTETRWNIFPSTTDGRWFEPQPMMTFDAPSSGSLEINDLNGDGLSDIIWTDADEPRLWIFLSPPRHAKGRNP
jgi:hypothetical protein